MRKRIGNLIAKYIFRDEIPLEGRIFNLVLLFGIVAELVAIVVRIIERVSAAAVLAVAGMVVVTAGALWLCNRFRRYRLGIWLALISVCDLLFPVIFFTNGGVSSGMTAYFVMCIVLIFFLLKGKECFIMLLIQNVIMVGCYLTAKFGIINVIPFKSDFPLYVDVIHSILVAGVLIGFIIKFQNKIYETEKEKAEAASKAKADFLASVSHEIRTPLNAIIGLGELELGKDLPRETTSNLEKMHNSGMSLLSIINDLLDISKIESGHFELIPAEYQTPSFINDTVNLNMVRIGSKPITFRLDIDENLPLMLLGDELRFRQILNNLLGIRQEDMGKLFSLYKQLDAGSNRHIEGTGMGLSICKNMTELMGGTISVQSEYGKGSVFTVRIPQVICDPRPIGREMADNLAQFRFTAKRRERRKTVLNPMPYGKVLVVDDVLTNLDVAKGMMLVYRLSIDCASSGKEAIQMIRDKKVLYDAVFMDHMMPEMDGIEAVRIIRNEIDGEYARTVPVIALTANALIGNDKLFLQNGFQDFLTKPIDMNKLDFILNKWVRNREKEHSEEWAPVIERMREGEIAAVPKEAAPEPAAFQPSSAGQSASVSGAPSIPGIDFAAGVKRMANREDAYIRVLTSYAANMPALLDKIRAVTVDTMADYTVNIHGIKGSSYGICADEVGKEAEALEMAAKNGGYETIFAKNDDFILQVEKLIGDLKNFIASR